MSIYERCKCNKPDGPRIPYKERKQKRMVLK